MLKCGQICVTCMGTVYDSAEAHVAVNGNLLEVDTGMCKLIMCSIVNHVLSMVIRNAQLNTRLMALAYINNVSNANVKKVYSAPGY